MKQKFESVSWKARQKNTQSVQQIKKKKEEEEKRTRQFKGAAGQREM